MASVHTFTDSRGAAVTMADRPFVAFLPKLLTIGDEIVLKGKIKDNAKMFSVNLTVDCGENIAYHFETNLTDGTVIQDYKIGGKWRGSAKSVPNTWIDGDGQEFTLTFYFDDSGIVVYTGDESRNMQYEFEYFVDIGTVRAIQVWDDVQHISEIIFRYGKKLLTSNKTDHKTMNPLCFMK